MTAPSGASLSIPLLRPRHRSLPRSTTRSSPTSRRSCASTSKSSNSVSIEVPEPPYSLVASIEALGASTIRSRTVCHSMVGSVPDRNASKSSCCQASKTRRTTSTFVSLRHRLPRQSHGFEGLVLLEERTRGRNPAAAQNNDHPPRGFHGGTALLPSCLQAHEHHDAPLPGVENALDLLGQRVPRGLHLAYGGQIALHAVMPALLDSPIGGEHMLGIENRSQRLDVGWLRRGRGYGPPHNLHVLVRNKRSPRRLGQWFQRNALTETLELTHQP